MDLMLKLQKHVNHHLKEATKKHIEETGMWPVWVMEQETFMGTGVTDSGRVIVKEPSDLVRFHCECGHCMKG